MILPALSLSAIILCIEFLSVGLASFLDSGLQGLNHLPAFNWLWQNWQLVYTIDLIHGALIAEI